MEVSKEEPKDAPRKPSNPPEEAPDPEEDDLDDLDGMQPKLNSYECSLL